MKICILGSYSGKLDEGMANVSYHLYSNLRQSCPDLVLVDLHDVKKLNFWKSLFHMKPDIVHYIPGPTLRGLFLVKLITLLTNSKSIVSATKPVFSKYFKIFGPFFKPNLVIVQSKPSENYFKNLNFKTTFIPNGVDADKFTPVDNTTKNEIRKKYGFNEKDFIVFHIGPMKSGRNQKSLLQIKDAKILLITSITNTTEQKAYQEVSENSNVIIWHKYFPNVEEIYAMVDVYVFPVFEKLNSIEIPLSVLEALSCNLPVITTVHDSLNMILEAGDGLFFIESEDQIPQIISKIKNTTIKINTRKKILSLSWQNISKDISKLYENVYGTIKK